MKFKLLTPPVAEPITLQEVKDHLRLSSSAEDALISELIKAAREYCESYTGRSLLTQTWLAYADSFDVQMELKPNLQAITSIKYVDMSGVKQTLAVSEYDIDVYAETGIAYPSYSKSWPTSRDETNAIEIEFVAGYGVADEVPASIKQSMLMLIGHWYMNRESVVVSEGITETPMAVPMLLDLHKVVSV